MDSCGRVELGTVKEEKADSAGDRVFPKNVFEVSAADAEGSQQPSRPTERTITAGGDSDGNFIENRLLASTYFRSDSVTEMEPATSGDVSSCVDSASSIPHHVSHYHTSTYDELHAVCDEEIHFFECLRERYPRLSPVINSLLTRLKRRVEQTTGLSVPKPLSETGSHSPSDSKIQVDGSAVPARRSETAAVASSWLDGGVAVSTPLRSQAAEVAAVKSSTPDEKAPRKRRRASSSRCQTSAVLTSTKRPALMRQNAFSSSEDVECEGLSMGEECVEGGEEACCWAADNAHQVPRVRYPSWCQSVKTNGGETTEPSAAHPALQEEADPMDEAVGDDCCEVRCEPGAGRPGPPQSETPRESESRFVTAQTVAGQTGGRATRKFDFVAKQFVFRNEDGAQSGGEEHCDLSKAFLNGQYGDRKLCNGSEAEVAETENSRAKGEMEVRFPQILPKWWDYAEESVLGEEGEEGSECSRAASEYDCSESTSARDMDSSSRESSQPCHFDDDEQNVVPPSLSEILSCNPVTHLTNGAWGWLSTVCRQRNGRRNHRTRS